MHLKASEPVNHMASGILESLRPMNVVFLVKPRFQFDYCDNIFPSFGGVAKQRDDL